MKKYVYFINFKFYSFIHINWIIFIIQIILKVKHSASVFIKNSGLLSLFSLLRIIAFNSTNIYSKSCLWWRSNYNILFLNYFYYHTWFGSAGARTSVLLVLVHFKNVSLLTLPTNFLNFNSFRISLHSSLLQPITFVFLVPKSWNLICSNFD